MTAPSTLPLRAQLAATKALPPPAMRRAIRQAAGVTLTQIAQELGVTRQAVHFWECGIRRPAGHHLIAYLKVLELLRDSMEARE